MEKIKGNNYMSEIFYEGTEEYNSTIRKIKTILGEDLNERASEKRNTKRIFSNAILKEYITAEQRDNINRYYRTSFSETTPNEEKRIFNLQGLIK
jgi:hypothetical protein